MSFQPIFYFEFLFKFPHNYAVPGGITSICQRAALGRTGPDFQFLPVQHIFFSASRIFQHFQIFPELATPASTYIFYLCWGRAPREIFPAHPVPASHRRDAPKGHPIWPSAAHSSNPPQAPHMAAPAGF